MAAFAIWDRLLTTSEMDDITDNGLGVGEVSTTRRIILVE